MTDVNSTFVEKEVLETVLFSVASVVLVCLAGIFSGLTLGILSQDEFNLKLLKRAGKTPRIKRAATKLLPLVRNYHRVLVTLVVSNMIAAEALPVFMDHIVSPLTAVLLSVTAILIFGEILPQAICARFGIHIAAHPLIRWPLRVLMFVFIPINVPIGFLLDVVLGKPGLKLHTKEELRCVIDIHHKHGVIVPIPFDDFATENEKNDIANGLLIT